MDGSAATPFVMNDEFSFRIALWQRSNIHIDITAICRELQMSESDLCHVMLQLHKKTEQERLDFLDYLCRFQQAEQNVRSKILTDIIAILCELQMPTFQFCCVMLTLQNQTEQQHLDYLRRLQQICH